MHIDELPDSNNLLVQKGNQLHIAILIIVTAFAVAYSLLHYVNGDMHQALASALLIPTSLIAYGLFHWANPTFSKVFNLIAVSAVISEMAFHAGQNTFVLVFFAPVLVSTLIVFQGRQTKLGYVLVGLTLIYLTGLLILGKDIRSVRTYTETELELEQSINLLGAIVVIVTEVIYILFIGNKFQAELIKIQKELWGKNLEVRTTMETRDKIISVMSHDIRSPLHLSQSGLNYLKEEETTEDKKQILQELAIRIGGILKLVDNLLLWSRSQTHNLQVNKTPISSESITQIIDGILILQGNSKVRFEIGINHTWIIEADKNMLEAIFRNLISNAIKFSVEQGIVEIHAQLENEMVTFSVRDNGVGMSPEILEKIQQGMGYTTLGTHKEKGYGIGLRLVCEFIKLHQSQLEINSTPGQGTQFLFRLPLLKSA
jgi:signal transduction histidine kinase